MWLRNVELRLERPERTAEMSDYPWSESMVCERVGAAPGALKELRKKCLMMSEHFVMRPGKGIFYSEAGLEAVVRVLSSESGICAAEGEKTDTAKAGTVAVVEKIGTVIRIYPGRKDMLLVRVDDCSQPVAVRVRDNRKFVIRQRLPLIPLQAGSPIMRLACREPMRRGVLQWVEGGVA